MHIGLLYTKLIMLLLVLFLDFYFLFNLALFIIFLYSFLKIM
ncbi:hypothetical protein H1P_1390014 [Hyella patelloides LEGE 07179]|uniref:Uncharacterized protein n=1 Tax=Hyella patelloides LEGE 07179 TaxID=945734 RepID=A0A563VL76_9CYAN|nr:hypothetical protein H1P_1390014 [Hyella patelloides LEGE 07179]